MAQIMVREEARGKNKGHDPQPHRVAPGGHCGSGQMGHLLLQACVCEHESHTLCLRCGCTGQAPQDCPKRQQVPDRLAWGAAPNLARFFLQEKNPKVLGDRGTMHSICLKTMDSAGCCSPGCSGVHAGLGLLTSLAPREKPSPLLTCVAGSGAVSCRSAS
jgi:hypothetical protein